MQTPREAPVSREPGNPTKRRELKLHTLSEYSDEDIKRLGERFVRRFFATHDPLSKNLIPFCSTNDGIQVSFSSSSEKILGRKNDLGIREVDKTRVQRIHWIKPILQDTAKGTVCCSDFIGRDMAAWVRTDAKYRIYWIPRKKYVVFLLHIVSKKGNTRFNLVSAYRVTEPETRGMLERLFPKQK